MDDITANARNRLFLLPFHPPSQLQRSSSEPVLLEPSKLLRSRLQSPLRIRLEYSTECRFRLVVRPRVPRPVILPSVPHERGKGATYTALERPLVVPVVFCESSLFPSVLVEKYLERDSIDIPLQLSYTVYCDYDRSHHQLFASRKRERGRTSTCSSVVVPAWVCSVVAFRRVTM